MGLWIPAKLECDYDDCAETTDIKLAVTEKSGATSQEFDYTLPQGWTRVTEHYYDHRDESAYRKAIFCPSHSRKG